MAWNSRGGAGPWPGPWPAAGAIAGLRLGCENKPGHRGQSRRGLTGTLLASRRSKTELADRNLSNLAPQPHPIREQRRIFEPGQQPQDHLFLFGALGGIPRRQAGVPFGCDHQPPHRGAPGWIAPLVFVLETQQAGFELVEAALANSLHHRRQRNAGFAHQLAQVVFRNRRQRTAQRFKFGLRDLRRTVFLQPARQLSSLSSYWTHAGRPSPLSHVPPCWPKNGGRPRKASPRRTGSSSRPDGARPPGPAPPDSQWVREATRRSDTCYTDWPAPDPSGESPRDSDFRADRKSVV